MHDVIVVGGGVIGLSIAREAAIGGRSVLVLERGAPGSGTSWAAAGMLAPQSEASADDPFFRLSLASLQRYRPWADALRERTTVDTEYAESGLLFLAPSEEEWKTLQCRAQWQRSAGLAVELLSPDDVKSLEPQITMPVVGAVHMSGEHQVTPRQLLKAIYADCTERGVEVRSGQPVDAILTNKGKAEGVQIASTCIPSGNVVVAAGVWSGAIQGLRPRIPMFPRKGQILSLSVPVRAFGRMIRWADRYVVPRRGGELIVGATNENAGFDPRLTPSGIGGLLAAAERLSSHAGAFPILEMWSGFRPATPDGLPVLGYGEIDHLIYACGHYRNGMLLAPITAAIVAALLEGKAPPVPCAAFRPGRFEV